MPPLAAIPLLIATAGPPYVIKEIHDGLYWLSDGAYNTMFLVSSEGVIAIDPLPTLGPRYLERTAEEVLAEEPFPVYLGRRGPIESVWFAHDDYENERIGRCYDLLAATWQPRLRGVERSLRSHCRTMIVALAIQVPPDGSRDRRK